MGKKPAPRPPPPMWVKAADLPKSAGHPFFERLNRILGKSGFDAFVAGLCAVFYAERMGRPSLRPGRYFRLLFIGYFEGLSSERAIAWRVADSLSLRAFLDLDVTEATPNHSTLSRTRRLIDVETHAAVFTWVLERLSEAGLVTGKTIGVDATTLEANAAMRSIERRDTGESYNAFVRGLAEASGVATPTLPETLKKAAEQVEAVQPDGEGVEEVVADKGYHSDATLVALDDLGVHYNRRRRWREANMAKTESRKTATERAPAPVAPGLARRDDTAAAVDVCRPALDSLGVLRDELNRIGGVVRDWPGGLPPVVAEPLQTAATAVGDAYLPGRFRGGRGDPVRRVREAVTGCEKRYATS